MTRRIGAGPLSVSPGVLAEWSDGLHAGPRSAFGGKRISSLFFCFSIFFRLWTFKSSHDFMVAVTLIADLQGST